MMAWIACGDATGNGTGEPRFEFVTGTPAPDTINALPMPTVLVELQDSDDDPLRGQQVVFETPGDEFHGVPQLFISDLNGERHAPITDTTDADGRAGVLVYRAAAAGTAWLRVRAPALALADSLPFEILPGRPVQIGLTPADTALRVGAAFSLGGRVLDRYSNLRPESVTFVPESSAVAVSGGAGTATVTAAQIGRAAVRASGAGLTERAWISVVPEGMLAFVVSPFDTGDSTAIATAATDGSGYTALFETAFDGWNTRPLDWAPGGQKLVFHHGSPAGDARLYHIDLAGTISRVISQGVGYSEVLPRYGADGWIYFTVETIDGNGTEEIWRVQPDGSAAERVGLPAAPYESDTYAAPAPDGLRVMFSTDRPQPGQSPVTLAVLRLDSATVTYLGVYGIGAVWSPLGDRVVFVNGVGAIVVMAPDGSGQRVVSPEGRAYEPYLDWSPDGTWIVAAGMAGVDIIEPDRGVTLPLAFSLRWRHPSWRP
jgi:hypothetical protein